MSQNLPEGEVSVPKKNINQFVSETEERDPGVGAGVSLLDYQRHMIGNYEVSQNLSQGPGFGCEKPPRTCVYSRVRKNFVYYKR